MNKYGNDAKVKKTLVRNFEQRSKPLARNSRKHTAVLDMGCSSNLLTTERSSRTSQKENELTQPSLCSSEALANYLSDVKKSLPSPEPLDEADECQLGAKITKKLNFHFNDRIYKNLIELNANVGEIKKNKNKKLTSSTSSTKRDLEPNIEDFCQDEKENDMVPNIPVTKPKFKPIRKFENGQLHKLIASFEDL